MPDDGGHPLASPRSRARGVAPSAGGDRETRILQPEGFRHEALLYAGEDEFVVKTGTFVRDGLEAGEEVLVVVGGRKIELLREHLGDDARHVLFADMARIGRNPAWIIAAWRDFVAARERSGRRLRGVGEPIDGSRDPDALVECQRHEALLNVAFAGSRSWWLVCPYDTSVLGPSVVSEALRTHPHVTNGGSHASELWVGLDACAARVEAPLPPAPGDALSLTFTRNELAAVRDRVAKRLWALGVDASTIRDLVLAVHELASNSVQHGGGSGTLRLWAEDRFVLAEVEDRGRIADPLAGRVRPAADGARGRGLWLATRLSDLLQIRTSGDGSVVRIRMRRTRSAG